MYGKLYCIGVGPGDPELLTIKALKAFMEVDVVAYPHSDKAGSEAIALRIAEAAYAGLEDKEKLPVYVPMTRDRDAVEKSLREGRGVSETIRLFREHYDVSASRTACVAGHLRLEYR